MLPTTAFALLLLIVGLSIAMMLVRPWNIPEVYWISGGALFLLVLRLIPLRLAGKAIAEGLDVYLFLIGMMLLSALARRHGVFDWVSGLAVRGARGSGVRLFTLTYAVGVVVTIFMSNDATAVVLTPAILTAVRKARVAPLPYLFVCALVANAASFVLPISNPANLVVYHGVAMPSLKEWLLAFGIPSLLSVVTTYLVMRCIFRTALRSTIEAKVDSEPLKAEGKLALVGLGLITAVLLTASAFKQDLGLPTCFTALAITLAVSIKTRSNPIIFVKEISWSTLLLVAGLFVMVDAMVSIGALEYTQRWLQAAQGVSPTAGAIEVGLVVAVMNNVVNNLPLGLIVGSTIQAAHVQGLLAHAILIGVDLGPNLSVTGSLATILWLLALREEGLSVSFWSFLRVGAIAMPTALFAALGGAILMKTLF